MEEDDSVLRDSNAPEFCIPEHFFASRNQSGHLCSHNDSNVASNIFTLLTNTIEKYTLLIREDSAMNTLFSVIAYGRSYNPDALRTIHTLPAGELSVNRVAEELHHNVNHIIRCFKREVGITPHQFIAALKLNLAIAYMRQGNQSHRDCRAARLPFPVLLLLLLSSGDQKTELPHRKLCLIRLYRIGLTKISST